MFILTPLYAFQAQSICTLRRRNSDCGRCLTCFANGLATVPFGSPSRLKGVGGMEDPLGFRGSVDLPINDSSRCRTYRTRAQEGLRRSSPVSHAFLTKYDLYKESLPKGSMSFGKNPFACVSLTGAQNDLRTRPVVDRFRSARWRARTLAQTLLGVDRQFSEKILNSLASSLLMKSRECTRGTWVGRSRRIAMPMRISDNGALEL